MFKTFFSLATRARSELANYKIRRRSEYL